jgi:hypothetical protein
MKIRVDPLTFAVLLPTLWAAHNVGDHIAQTDHEAANKATDWSAMAGHIGSYQSVQTVAAELVLRSTGLRRNRWAGLAGAVFSAGSHAFIDRRWPVRKLLRATGAPGYAELALWTRKGEKPFRVGMYQADQALHHGCLLIAALIMAARRG